MYFLRPLLAALLLAACALPAAAQTIKTLGFNSTNGRVVANTGTNVLTFTNNVKFDSGDIQFVGTQIIGNGLYIDYDDGSVGGGPITLDTNASIAFQGASATITRTNLGLGATWLTNTNVTNFRSAVGFSTNLNALWTATNAVNVFDALNLGLAPDEGGSLVGSAAVLWDQTENESGLAIVDGDPIFGIQGAGPWRTNLALGATNIVTFAGITNNGDIRINQTTSTNGLLFVYRTNNEAFLGVANLIASNNTTLSNETLFRVGRSEATNQSAQFGFRVVRTNNGGEGFATFSVFGYNALMMIGPSDRSRTNTATNAAIEADIWTINQTNRVMTLRDTNSGALTLHQDLGFNASLTNAAPTNTNTPAVWMRVWVGTNNYRLPLYQ